MESSTFKEAFEEIRKLSMDPETVDLAISREIALRDHITPLEDAENRGKTEGLTEGDKNARIEMVLNMHAEGLPSKLICKMVNLSSEEVQSIIDTHAEN